MAARQIREMSQDKAISEPSYYELLSNIPLNKSLYYPLISKDSYLLTFKEANLLDPKSVPICKFHYAGILKFIINEDEFAACDIDKRLLDERSRLLHEAALIDNYQEIQWWLGKRTKDHIGESRGYHPTLMSALYKMENGIEEYHKICVYKC